MFVLAIFIFHLGSGNDLQPAVELPKDPMSNEFIVHINSLQNLWTAGRNFHRNTSLPNLNGLMGDNSSKLEILTHNNTDTAFKLPVNFDARDHWPDCPSISEISDQGSCGSCWAFAAVTTMTDRVCIHSNGTENFHFSAQDLISCCPDCGGCEGGKMFAAWNYWKNTGIVSGGSYGSDSGCVPYQTAPCSHYIENSTLSSCPKMFSETPKCVKQCQNDLYETPYNNDLHRGQRVYRIDNNIDQIKYEIYTNGPVQGAFTVYEDFLHYKSGVYKHVNGNFVYGHAVRILGWGEENNTSYWLAANSWNNEWGDKGFFKILRGNNECGIEFEMNAGIPEFN